jgi:acyl transferase domain-containing protein
LRIASVKSNIGHAEVAAGVLSVIKVVQMMRHRLFLPSAGVTMPRKDFEWEAHNMVVQQHEEPFPANELVTVGVNSFGIGGAYGHVVLQEYVQSPWLVATQRSAALQASAQEEDKAPLPGCLFPLSGASLAHLQASDTHKAYTHHTLPILPILSVLPILPLLTPPPL